jgi:hypothetical protein
MLRGLILKQTFLLNYILIKYSYTKDKELLNSQVENKMSYYSKTLCPEKSI